MRGGSSGWQKLKGQFRLPHVRFPNTHMPSRVEDKGKERLHRTHKGFHVCVYHCSICTLQEVRMSQRKQWPKLKGRLLRLLHCVKVKWLGHTKALTRTQASIQVPSMSVKKRGKNGYVYRSRKGFHAHGILASVQQEVHTYEKGEEIERMVKASTLV